MHLGFHHVIPKFENNKSEINIIIAQQFPLNKTGVPYQKLYTFKNRLNKM